MLSVRTIALHDASSVRKSDFVGIVTEGCWVCGLNVRQAIPNGSCQFGKAQSSRRAVDVASAIGEGHHGGTDGPPIYQVRRRIAVLPPPPQMTSMNTFSRVEQGCQFDDLREAMMMMMMIILRNTNHCNDNRRTHNGRRACTFRGIRTGTNCFPSADAGRTSINSH